MTNTSMTAATAAAPPVFPDKPSKVELHLPIARLYWHALLKPVSQPYKGSTEAQPLKYKATLVIDKSIAAKSPEWARLKEVMGHYGTLLFTPKELQSESFKGGVADGDKKEQGYYQGAYVINATQLAEYGKPSVMDADCKPLTAGEYVKVGQGALCRALVAPYTFNKGAAGFGFNLRAIVILSHGEARVEKDYSKSFEGMEMVPDYAKSALAKAPNLPSTADEEAEGADPYGAL